MKHNNNVTIAALIGIVAGALLSAGAAQYAQVLAFQSMSPSAAMELDGGADHYSRSVIRERSNIGSYRLRTPRRIEIPLNLGNESLRSAAPDYKMPEHCEGYSGARLVKCIVEFRDNDIIYQPQQ